LQWNFYNTDRMDLHTFLPKIFLFSSFSENELNLLESSASWKKVSKGEQIFAEGLEASAFFIVSSGKVKIYKVSADGREHILHIHGPGDLVAEAAIFDSMVYPASCMTLEDSSLVRISREGFFNLINKYPELALKMMSSYSKRLRQLVLKIENLTLKDIKSRLAGYLLENSTIEKGITVCRLKYSKKELSSLLGTIPETLSRSFAFLKQQDLIVEKNNLIIITDPEKLRLLSL
jgi:CRP-like cAMP-binding protein